MNTAPRPDPALSRKLPDPIADMRPTGKFIKRLQELAKAQQAAERNV